MDSHPKFQSSMINYNVLPIGDNDNIVEYLRSIQSQKDYFVKLKVFEKTLLSPNIQEAQLISWLKQFKDNIFFLGKENERLTVTILSMDWIHKSPEVIRVHQELVLNLVSAHSYSLSLVFMMLIKLFSTVEDNEEHVTEKERINFCKGHDLLKRILPLVPMSSNVLCFSLSKNFPYMRKESRIHVRFVTNILEICTYLPSHRQVILDDLFNKLVAIDTNCYREEIELAEESASDEILYAMEQNSPDGFEKSNSCSMALPLANTLDLLMDCVLNFIDHTCRKKDKTELDMKATKLLFKEILTLFDKHILPTPECTNVQFILFYLCSLSSVLQELFLDYLWKKILDPNTAITKRKVATFYFGSFLARALCVNSSTVAACLDLMCIWVHTYIDNNSCPNLIDLSIHEIFYVLCQTIFYVFVFRHRELVAMKKGLNFLVGLNFERIISCKLNPLNICLPVIVENFAKLTIYYQIAYCNTVIEKNNRNLINRVIRSQMDNSVTLDVAILKTVFPFDPYLLKCSKKWINPLYRIYDSSTEEIATDNNESMEETSLLPSMKSQF